MPGKTLLAMCLVVLGVAMSNSAIAQSYLQSGELNSIRQSNQAAPQGGDNLRLTPPAAAASGSDVSAQFNQGLAENEQRKRLERETSAMGDMRTKELMDPQRPAANRFPGNTQNNQGAVYFGEDGQTFCRKDPATNQYQCGSSSR